MYPTVYEVNATLDTLKKMYANQVKDLEQNRVEAEIGEEN
jgi:hypothetical protein